MLSILKELLSKNPLRQMAEADRKVLAICIGAAFCFWLILNLSRDYSINREVTVDYLVDPERVLVGRMPGELDAVVSGSGWNLMWESLRPGALPVEVDVRNRENLRLSGSNLERQINRRLSSSNLSARLPGFESLPILTTPKEGKRVPIVNRVRVGFARGHRASRPAVVTPDSITLSGATDALEEIDSWPTEEVTLADVTGNVVRDVALVAPPTGLTLSHDRVEFALAAETYIDQTFQVTVAGAATARGRYEFTPAVVTITASVPQSEFNEFTAEDFGVSGDFASVRPDSDSKTVPLVLTRQPRSAFNVRVEPRTVEFYLVE